ncbi:MAG: MBL fold metallo-hydrolase, partial [Myxococcota bacterium]
DLFHSPLQMAHPDWTDIADVDGALAFETRQKFLESYADGPVLILGTHFASPTAGHIVRDGDTFRFSI